MTTTSKMVVKTAANAMLRTTTSHCVRLMTGLRTFVSGAQIGTMSFSDIGVSGLGSASKSNRVLEADDEKAVVSEYDEPGELGGDIREPTVTTLSRFMGFMGVAGGTMSVVVGDMGEGGSTMVVERPRGGA